MIIIIYCLCSDIESDDKIIRIIDRSDKKNTSYFLYEVPESDI